MKKILSASIRALLFTVIAGVTALGFSGYAYAQLVDTNLGTPYMGTVTSTTVVSNAPCTVLSYNLFLGQESSSVAALQTYLVSAGYMSHEPTGFYGALTFAAVVKFQGAQGILRTGTAGPITRARIQALSCGGVPNPVPTPIAPLSLYSMTPSAGPVGGSVTLLGTGFTPTGNKIYFGTGFIGEVTPDYIACGAYGGPSCTNGGAQLRFTIPSSVAPYCAPGMACPMYMQLVTPGTYPIYVVNANGTSNTLTFQVIGSGGVSGNSLSISGIDAPNTIPMSVSGTWTVRVNAAQYTNLHYSVIWGDEMYGTSGIMAPSSNPIASSATFTHAYVRAGSYNPTFTVSDDYGHTATLSTSVLVTPMY